VIGKISQITDLKIKQLNKNLYRSTDYFVSLILVYLQLFLL
jgi:hypothetical protein